LIADIMKFAELLLRIGSAFVLAMPAVEPDKDLQDFNMFMQESIMHIGNIAEVGACIYPCYSS